jgi:hypothetical protein
MIQVVLLQYFTPLISLGHTVEGSFAEVWSYEVCTAKRIHEDDNRETSVLERNGMCSTCRSKIVLV